MFKYNDGDDREYLDDVLQTIAEQPRRFHIINYKITPKQLAEIESHLQLAGHILNSEDVPNWEDLNTACRQISDAMQNLKWIREKSSAATA